MDIEHQEKQQKSGVDKKAVRGKRKRTENKLKENKNEDSSEKSSADTDENSKKKEQATVESMQGVKVSMTKKVEPRNDKVKKDEETSAFPIKLKKAEPIKRAITEQKLEIVQLKHHAFESQPKQPEPEKPSSIKLTVPIEQKDEDTSDQIQKKKKTLKKKQKKIIPDIELENERQSKATPHPKEDSDDDESSDNLTESESINDISSEPVIDKNSKEDSVLEDEKSSPKTIEEKNMSITSNKSLEKLKISSIKKPEPKNNDMVIKDEERPTFPVKLKKAEQIKRPIVEPKLETIKLKHHSFEGQPQEPEAENPSSIRLTIPLTQKDDETSHNMQKKKKIFKKQKKLLKNDEDIETQSKASTPRIDNSDIDEISDITEKMPDSESTDNILPGAEDTVKETLPVINKSPEFNNVSDEKMEYLKIKETITEEEKITIDSTESHEGTQKTGAKINEKTKNDEENFAFPVKLKKAEPIKRDIAETKLEVIQLKHHTFEDQPQEPEAELSTQVILNVPLKQTNEETKDKVLKKKKILKKKHKKVPEIEPDSETQSRESSPTKEISDIDELYSANERMHEIESQTEVTPNHETPKEIKLPEKEETNEEKILICKKESCQIEEKKEAEEILSKKLKKTVPIQRKIEESKLESVELKHHDFEPCPQENIDEKSNKLCIGVPLQYTDDTDNATENKKTYKKTKKKHKKINKEDASDSETIEDNVISQIPDENKDNIEIPIETTKDDSKINMKKKASIKKQPVKEKDVIEPKPLRKAKIVQKERVEDKKEEIKLKHHNFESIPLDNVPEMTTSIKLSKPLSDTIDDMEGKKSKKIKNVSKKVTKKATESEILSPMQDKESPFEDDLLNAEQAKITKIADHKKVIKGTNQLGFEPTKEKAERKERDPIAVPGAAIPKKHSDFGKVELPTYLNYPSEQGVSILADEVDDGSENICSDVEIIIERIHEDSDEKHTPVTEEGIKTNKATKVVKKTVIPKKTTIKELNEDPSESEPFVKETLSEILSQDVLDKPDTEFREIPITIEKDKTKKTKMVTKKTVTENQVGS